MKNLILILFALCLLPGTAMAGEAAGRVREMLGVVRVTHAAADTPIEDLKIDAPLFMGDIIETQEGARAVLSFADGGELVITGAGRMVIDEFVFDPNAANTGTAHFSLLGFAFSWLGGTMDEKGDVSLKLDYGSIGIRGTKLMGVMRNGLDWVYLENGGAEISNGAGAVALQPGYGTRIVSAAEAPSAPYMWGEAEIGWLKNLVDDPSSHIVRSVALNADSKRQRMPEDATAAAPSVAGGGSATGMAAAERASAPAAAADMPARMSDSSQTKTTRAKAEGGPSPVQMAGKVGGEKLLLSLNNLSPAQLGTKLAQDKDGALLLESRWPTTVNIAQLDTKIDGTVLNYTAEAEALEITGQAYLEIWVHIAGEKGGYYFGRGLDKPLKSAGGWQKLATQFTLKPGQVADSVTLNVVLQGKGRIRLRNISLTRGD